ncbi:hypothetical protein E0L36_23320 [Streptomyces sp. AJS327]|nr:hypothetical protein [Streptomyces sp. AJS327]
MFSLDPASLLRLTPDMLAALLEGGRERARTNDDVHRHVVETVQADGAARADLLRACHFEAPFGESWLHQPGRKTPYLSLELLAEALGEGELRAALTGIVLSPSASIPFDYRALAAEGLVLAGAREHLAELTRAAEAAEPLPWRSTATKIGVRSDGVDHLFPIPRNVEERLELLRAASAAKTRETTALLARRVVRACARETGPEHGVGGADTVVPPSAKALRSAPAERLIAEDLGTWLATPADYLVPWDQELAEPAPGEAPLTLAELLRVTLLCPEFKLPDVTVRPVLLDFYRSVLRISGRAIIGLGAGVFHVEHGVDADPSYLYLGRDTVLGKGTTLDCVGGVVLQRGAFLGGGFMPILIHTHKHIRKRGEPGSAERKRVLPAIFAAEAGARLPMHAIGLFETADYLGADSGPHEGIRALALDD